jgi:drug/metabolite transporter (DMT)-like permease
MFRQPVSRRFLMGSAIAVPGVALLFIHEFRAAELGGHAVILGLTFCFCGLMSASTANVLQGTRIGRETPILTVLGYAMLVGLLLDGAIAWSTEGPPVVDLRPGYVFGVLYLSLAGSVATFPLYFQLIRDMGAGRAAYNGVAVPVLAMLLSTLFEGYVWTSLTIGGALLSMLGLLVSLYARASPAVAVAAMDLSPSR